MWQNRAGLGNSPRTVLDELARIQSNDVVLPTATHEIRLRCITQPDAAQAALLDRLGIVLPKRMRLTELERLPLTAWPHQSDRNCGADFADKLLILQDHTTDSAQVGLTPPRWAVRLDRPISPRASVIGARRRAAS